jgi:hypothetical protein
VVKRLTDPPLTPSSQQAGGQLGGNAFLVAMSAPGSVPISPQPSADMEQHLPLPVPVAEVPVGDPDPVPLPRPRDAGGKFLPASAADPGGPWLPTDSAA